MTGYANQRALALDVRALLRHLAPAGRYTVLPRPEEAAEITRRLESLNGLDVVRVLVWMDTEGMIGLRD